VVTLRPSTSADAPTLIAGRDAEFHRFMGDGSPDPRPTACIVVDGTVVGWVDHDIDRQWLAPGECNLGYNVFAAHRGHGYATRAVQLLLDHLAAGGELTTATLLINPANAASLALAHRLRFTPRPDLDGQAYFTRGLPPPT